MKLYGAIDLHSNNNVTVMIDERDQVAYQKRCPMSASPPESVTEVFVYLASEESKRITGKRLGSANWKSQTQ